MTSGLSSRSLSSNSYAAQVGFHTLKKTATKSLQKLKIKSHHFYTSLITRPPKLRVVFEEVSKLRETTTTWSHHILGGFLGPWPRCFFLKFFEVEKTQPFGWQLGGYRINRMCSNWKQYKFMYFIYRYPNKKDLFIWETDIFPLPKCFLMNFFPYRTTDPWNELGLVSWGKRRVERCHHVIHGSSH